MALFAEYVAAALGCRADELARHWQARARAATPRRFVGTGAAALTGDAPGDEGGQLRDASREPPDDAGYTDRADAAGEGTDGGGRDLDGANASDPAACAVVRAFAAGLTRDARPIGEVMQLGWTAGLAAHAQGLSVHHVQRDAELLLAVLLTEVERISEALPDDLIASPAEAIAVARRIHQLGGRYAQAAGSGFLHALLDALRARWRTLRHDLRNPLGTIQSALSLMEDESLPTETRHGPRIRAMVSRNAGSLDALIGAQLGDQVAAGLLTMPHPVALRDVVLAARREVRQPSRLAGCEIVIGDVPDDPPALVDAAALELALTALLLAGLTGARAGDAIRVDYLPLPTAGDPPAGSGTTSHAEGSRAALGAGHVIVGGTFAVRLVPADAPRGLALLDGAGATRASTPGAADLWWDEAGLALAASMVAEQGGRLVAPDHAGRGDAERRGPDRRGADERAEEAAALAQESVIWLVLPSPAGGEGERRPRGGRSAEPTRTRSASASASVH